jgi:hypothetical protein
MKKLISNKFREVSIDDDELPHRAQILVMRDNTIVGIDPLELLILLEELVKQGKAINLEEYFDGHK